MEELDRAGVKFTATFSTAFAAAILANPAGIETAVVAAAAAGVPVLLSEILDHRARRFAIFGEQLAAETGMTPDELIEWSRLDARRADFLAEGVEAAWSTSDDARLRLLAQVLADGVSDAAKLDISQLLIRAIRQMDRGHIQVLGQIEEVNPSLPNGEIGSRWSRAQVSDRFESSMGSGLDPVLATLRQVGCIELHSGPYGPPMYVLTAFGQDCLNRVRDA